MLFNIDINDLNDGLEENMNIISTDDTDGETANTLLSRVSKIIWFHAMKGFLDHHQHLELNLNVY